MINWLFTNWIELVAALLGILFILFEIKEHIIMWPIGIAQTCFYVVVYYNVSLYADTLLNMYYVIMGIIGWYWWRKGTKDELKISRISKKGFIISLSSIIIFTTGFGYYLHTQTDASFPFWDSLTTAIGVIATILLGRKVFEQWHLWIIANGISIVLYINKDLIMTAVLFAILFVLSFVGLFQWKRKLQETND